MRYLIMIDTIFNIFFGHFHCDSCGYNADRDYNASLNIGRLALSNQRHIKNAKVVTYKDTTSLGARSLRAYHDMEKVLQSMLSKSYLIAVSPVKYVIKCTNLT